MSASLLASIDEAYHGVTASVHDAEVAVETAWQQSPPGKWWAAYTTALKTNPVRTKAMTSFVGFVLGDVMAQRIAGVTVLDPLRCLRLGCYGLFVDGPFGHLWYKVLDKRVEPENPNGLKAVLLKTAADQLFWAPIMTCVFFVVLKSLEGHPELIWPTIQDKLVKTIVANYILWPGAHFINFRFVPSEHRILYNNVVSVAWNAYLSTLSHDAVLDTSQLLGLLDNAEDLLNSWIPQELVDAFASHDGLKGLQFDIPRTIDLKPTRTLLDFLPLLSEEKGI
jgi:protein Mpv17